MKRFLQRGLASNQEHVKDRLLVRGGGGAELRIRLFASPGSSLHPQGVDDVDVENLELSIVPYSQLFKADLLTF